MLGWALGMLPQEHHQKREGGQKAWQTCSSKMDWDDDDEGFFDAVDQLVEQHKQAKVHSRITIPAALREPTDQLCAPRRLRPC